MRHREIVLARRLVELAPLRRAPLTQVAEGVGVSADALDELIPGPGCRLARCGEAIVALSMHEGSSPLDPFWARVADERLGTVGRATVGGVAGLTHLRKDVLLALLAPPGSESLVAGTDRDTGARTLALLPT